MPSQNYAWFEHAIRTRKQIVCVYGGYPRELCPIILGHSQGQEKALTYQFGGQSKSGLPPQGEWRCLWLSKVSDVEVSDVQLRDGPWFAGSSHTSHKGASRLWVSMSTLQARITASVPSNLPAAVPVARRPIDFRSR